MWQQGKLIAAGVLIAAIAGMASQASAEPLRRTGVYSWQSTTAEPQRGYEGWVGTGRRTRYCSYYRVPNRECDSRGCRVVSWTMNQSCN